MRTSQVRLITAHVLTKILGDMYLQISDLTSVFMLIVSIILKTMGIAIIGWSILGKSTGEHGTAHSVAVSRLIQRPLSSLTHCFCIPTKTV